MQSAHRQPFIVGLGGSARAASLTDELLRVVLADAEELGARTLVFDAPFLMRLPVYTPDGEPATAEAAELSRAVASADGLIIASPGYHGGPSGLVKNGLDHLESLRSDARPYLDGRSVGVIVTAAGWQACGSTLSSLRATIHALRGWPTPFAATVNSAEPVYAEAGALLDHVAAALRLVTRQVVDFATGSVPRR
jgi:FMN reductase